MKYLLILLLAGCATLKEKPVQVLVPVPTACAVNVTCAPCQPFTADNVLDEIKDLRQCVTIQQGCIALLTAGLNICKGS